jgi:two-component system cell cycle response regulator
LKVAIVKILIADDDAVSRRLLAGTLAQFGHEVVAVEDGDQAAAALLAPDAPQLAIIDWVMPGLDGLEVCRRLRQRPTPYTYIILLTSRDRRSDMLQALDAGADDFLSKPCDPLELRVRLRSGERVIALQAGLIETQEALRFEATHDRLTGIWSRGTILDHLERELSRARREKGSMAVLLADLDHFKRVNDLHGHVVGDIVLRETGRRMRSGLRAYDGIGRYGGEEFLLVLDHTDIAGAKPVAERIRCSLGCEPMHAESVTVTVTTSIGVTDTATAGYSSDALIQAADRALYQAKALGRDRVQG